MNENALPLVQHLKNFVSSRSVARTLEEIILHKPFFDLERNTVCFILDDLCTYLYRQTEENISKYDVHLALVTELGASVTPQLFKGKVIPVTRVSAEQLR